MNPSKSSFHIAKMDCPSEEQQVRMALASTTGIIRLEFDFAERTLTAWHQGSEQELLAALDPLGLDTRLRSTEEVSAGAEAEMVSEQTNQSKVLRLVLLINLLMFGVELAFGWIAESSGLLADSLDMLADSAVYGIALWAVGRAASLQRTAARLSGWLQLALALGVLAEVARRALMGSFPEPPMIMGIATLAFIANVTSMLLLARQRDQGAHMQASWIFTTNDVIANIGVIIAGVLVSLTSSAIPDLVVGTLIGLLVLRGALRILKIK